ncbi:flagellar export protein FliJ [Candidatus Latescibacterota bacterium]
MNRFRFRLESVLRFRRAKEDEKKREFGHTLGKLKTEERKYNDIVNSGESHDRLVEKSGQGKMSLRSLINNFYYARHIEQTKAHQEQMVEAAKVVTDEKRAELVEATKKKKVIDRLKDRKLEEYQKAELKEEQDYIDDIAAQRFNRDKGLRSGQ